MSVRYEETYSRGGDSDFFKYIALIASIGAAVSVAMVILSLLKMGIDFSSGPLLIVVLADIGLTALLFIIVLSETINRNNILRFGTIALAVLILFINLFVQSYISAADDFINEIYSPRITSAGAIEYSVIAQQTAGVVLNSKNAVRAGIQNDDPLRQDAENETKRLSNASFTEFENLATMIDATEESELDIAVVQSAILKAYAEYFPDEYDNLDVLATFRVGNDASAATDANVKIDITKPFMIYISGLDDFGEIDNITARSDFNMIVCIDPERYKMLLVATPRDYYVQLHGTTGVRDKLAHAGVYGISMSKKTLEDLYGFNVDYVMLINFDTIVTLVDSMGGILVDNPTTFDLWGQTYKEGRIWLNGDMALLFSRARKSLARGDIDRVANQQLVIQGIMDRITDPRMVVNYKTILGNMAPYFRSNVPPDIYTQLFSRQISLGGDWDVTKLVANGTPASRPTYSMGSQELDVILPDDTSLNEIRTEIYNFMHRID